MTDLTERHVSATVRSIPESQRADIEAELRASIDDAIEARLADGAVHDEAERGVLLDLGDPDRLASGYSGRPGHLIGPELFFDYKRLLAVLLVTVLPIVAAVVFAVTLLADDGIGAAFGNAIGTALTVALHIFFWVTLVFAILERTDGATSVTAWDLSKLPPIPSRRSVSLAETIATLVFLTLTITVLLISRSFSPFAAADGSPLPLFNPELWSFWMPFLIGVLILELVFELVKYRIGHWTGTLAWLNLGLNLLFAAPAVYLLMSEQLFNPVFFDALGLDLGMSSDSPLVLITVAVIVGIAAWDSIDGFRKAARG
jgi:hypothetical protein